MAKTYAKNAQLRVDGKKIPAGEYNGTPKTAYDEKSFTAETLLAADQMVVATVPKGARIIRAVILASGAVGAAGNLQLGYLDNGKDGASAAGLGTAVQTGSGVLPMQGVEIGRKFQAETEIVLSVSANATSATGKTLKTVVEFLVD